MIRRFCSRAAIGVVLLSLAAITPVGRAADDPKPDAAAQTRQFLLGDTPAERFVPLHPRTAADLRHLESLAQFCYGRWLENESRFADAIAAYRKAIESDPSALPIYKELITLCGATGRSKDVAKYLQQALEIAPDDYELLRRMAERLLEEGQVDAAKQFLKKAVESPKLDAHQPLAVQLKLALGELYRQTRDLEHAADLFQEVMQAIERPAEFHLDRVQPPPEFLRNPTQFCELFGAVFREAKRYDNALRALRLAQAHSPRSTRFSQNIADVYIDQERFAEALDELERLFASQTPGGSQAYEMLAVVLEKLDRGDELLPRVQAAADKDRFNIRLQFFLGSLYEKAGDTAKAEEIYTAVVKDGGDERVYAALAEIYRDSDRMRELILVLGAGVDKQIEGRTGIFESLKPQYDALKRDRDAAEKLVRISREMAQDDPKQFKFGARYAAAHVATDARLIDDAAEFYRLCIADRPRREVLALIYREFSLVLLASDRAQEAVAVIRESMRDGGRSNDPQVHGDLAWALELAGNTDEALKTAQEVVRSAPDELTGYEALARIHTHSGHYEKAAEQYEHIIRNFGDREGIARVARYLLSNVYTQLGDNTKAEKVLEEVLEDDPDDPSANNDLGYLWADQGKHLDRAYEMIRKALAAEPENAAYLDSMGWVLYKLDRAAEARPFLESAAGKVEAAGDGTIIDHLGDVYMKLGETAKARESWRKAADVLEHPKRERRDDKRLNEVREKLKSIEDRNPKQNETNREE